MSSLYVAKYVVQSSNKTLYRPEDHGRLHFTFGNNQMILQYNDLKANDSGMYSAVASNGASHYALVQFISIGKEFCALNVATSNFDNPY